MQLAGQPNDRRTIAKKYVLLTRMSVIADSMQCARKIAWGGICTVINDPNRNLFANDAPRKVVVHIRALPTT